MTLAPAMLLLADKSLVQKLTRNSVETDDTADDAFLPENTDGESTDNISSTLRALMAK